MGNDFFSKPSYHSCGSSLHPFCIVHSQEQFQPLSMSILGFSFAFASHSSLITLSQKVHGFCILPLRLKAPHDGGRNYGALPSFGITELIFTLHLVRINLSGALSAQCSSLTAIASQQLLPRRGRDANLRQEVSGILFCRCAERCPTPYGAKLSHVNARTHEFVTRLLQAFSRAPRRSQEQ